MNRGKADGDEKEFQEANRKVNLRKLLHVVKVKSERSERGRAFALYIIFVVFYIVTLILQRKALHASSVSSGLLTYFQEGTFLDPGSFEVKRLEDVNTFVSSKKKRLSLPVIGS